jgi:transposase
VIYIHLNERRIMTTESRTRVEEIIWCEGQADQVVKDAAHDASELRWTAAKLITEELATGKTQREVAEEIGKGHQHVGRMTQVYKIFGGALRRQERSFDSYYKEVQDRGPKLWQPIVRELSDQGLSNRAIGKKLGLDEKTVRTHLARAEEVRPETPATVSADGQTCTPMNPFPGTLEAFVREGRLLVQLRQIKESRADFNKVRKAVAEFTAALDKIERKHHS